MSFLFSYNANWESAGRWWVEFLTNKNRYLMKPMEQLFVQKRGSISLDKISPGIYFIKTEEFSEKLVVE